MKGTEIGKRFLLILFSWLITMILDHKIKIKQIAKNIVESYTKTFKVSYVFTNKR